MLDNFGQFLIVVAAIVVIAVGAIYLSDHVACFNWFGLAKGCVVR